MQPQFVGDFAQHQRPHRQFAVHEETLLALDDGVGHAQYGVEALLYVLDEPARLLQPLLQRLMALAPVRLERARVDIVNAQPGHDIGIELHPKARLLAAAGLGDQHVGNDDVALDVDKAPPGLGLETGDQADCRPDLRVAVAAQLRQPLHITPGQQVHRLCANTQRRGARGVRVAVGLHGLELQRQAFAERTGAHAHRVQVMEQSQRHGEAMNQFFLLLGIVARQGGGERLQRLIQVAIVVERFDQESQCAAVFLGQAQRKSLPVEMGLQRLIAEREVGGVDLFVAAQVVFSRRRIAAPLAIVGNDFGAAVAVPAGRLGFQGGGGLGFRCRRRGRVVGELGFTVVLRHRGVGLGQPEFLTRRFVEAQLQEGVLVEHLLDFLRQLERGQLQQPDRLLQLRRQRQMLGDTKR